MYLGQPGLISARCVTPWWGGKQFDSVNHAYHYVLIMLGSTTLRKYVYVVHLHYTGQRLRSVKGNQFM